MGIEKVGISIIKNVIKSEARTLLRTKPTAKLIRGINPILTYAPSGKSFALQRFCSIEMKEARAMNRIAIEQIKARNVTRAYSKATAQDFKRLTSETIEDNYTRVEWTNPKDGKVYNLLKQGETEDGKVIIRILNQEGDFIKEAQITPKKIIIIDDFSSGKNIIRSSSTMFEPKTHGDIVALLAKRSNPYAKLELIDIHDPNTAKTIKNFHSEIKNLQSRIDAGEKFDYVSLSLGITESEKESISILKDLGLNPFEMKTSNVSLNHPYISHYPASEFAIKNKGQVRVIQGSANGGKDNINIWLSYPGIEGCGSLGFDGKIAGFSSSRNSLYTQHYEQGFFKFTPNSRGMSITSMHNIDIPLKEELIPLANSYIGTKPIITTAEENKILNTLRKQVQDKYYTEISKLRKEIGRAHV